MLDFLESIDLFINNKLKLDEKNKLEKYSENDITELYIDLLNHISILENRKFKKDSLNYEILAKLIVFAKDIIANKLIFYYENIFSNNNELSLRKIFVPYINFIDLINIEKTEGSYKFDAENAVIFENNTINLYVHATANIDTREQTDLLFLTHNNNFKNIYLISDEIIKDVKHLNNIKKENCIIYPEELEIIRFLVLIEKTSTTNNINKNLNFYFNTILFLSNGFLNSFNKDIFLMAYPDEEFNIKNILSLNYQTIPEYKLLNYLENFIFSFCNKLNFEYLKNNDGYLQSKSQLLLKYIYHIIKSMNFSELKDIADNIEVISKNSDFDLKLFRDDNKNESLMLEKILSENLIAEEMVRKKFININNEDFPLFFVFLDYDYTLTLIEDFKKVIYSDFNFENNYRNNFHTKLSKTELITLLSKDFFEVINKFLFFDKSKYKNVKIFLIEFIFSHILDEENLNIIKSSIFNSSNSNKEFEINFKKLFNYFTPMMLEKNSYQYYVNLNLLKLQILEIIFYPNGLKNTNFPEITNFLLLNKYHTYIDEYWLDKLISLLPDFINFKNYELRILNYLKNNGFNAFDFFNLYKKLKFNNKFKNFTSLLEYEFAYLKLNEGIKYISDFPQDEYILKNKNKNYSLIRLNHKNIESFLNYLFNNKVFTANKNIINEYIYLSLKNKSIYFLQNKNTIYGFVELRENLNETFSLLEQNNIIIDNNIKNELVDYIDIGYFFISKGFRNKGLFKMILKEIINQKNKKFALQCPSDSFITNTLYMLGFKKYIECGNNSIFTKTTK